MTFWYSSLAITLKEYVYNIYVYRNFHGEMQKQGSKKGSKMHFIFNFFFQKLELICHTCAFMIF